MLGCQLIFHHQIDDFLFVSVPPKKPTIFNERGEEALGTVGPYMIGGSVVLKCIAVGGELTKGNGRRD